jgi:hypothetical protein
MDTDVIVIACPSSEIVESEETVTVATAGHVEAERVTVEIRGQDEALGHTLQLVGPTLVGDVIGLEEEVGEVVGLDEILGDVAAVLALGPAKKEHALDSLDAEEEHADTNAGIEGAGTIVYVRQKAKALVGLPDSALKQLSALQLALTVRIKKLLTKANKM